MVSRTGRFRAVALVCASVVFTACRTPSESSDPPSETPPASPSSGGAPIPLEDLSGYALHAPGSWWSREIRDAPVDRDSEVIELGWR